MSFLGSVSSKRTPERLSKFLSLYTLQKIGSMSAVLCSDWQLFL